MLERLPACFQYQSLLRIHAGGFSAGYAEKFRVKHIDLIKKCAIPRRFWKIRRGIFRAPPACRHFRYDMPGLIKERLKSRQTGNAAGQSQTCSDDCNRPGIAARLLRLKVPAETPYFEQRLFDLLRCRRHDCGSRFASRLIPEAASSSSSRAASS